MEKIKADVNPILIFDENRGFQIYKAVFNLAKQHGYGFEWVEEEAVECGDDALDWLNENACEGCRLDWYEGGLWAFPDDYDTSQE